MINANFLLILFHLLAPECVDCVEGASIKVFNTPQTLAPIYTCSIVNVIRPGDNLAHLDCYHSKGMHWCFLTVG